MWACDQVIFNLGEEKGGTTNYQLHGDSNNSVFEITRQETLQRKKEFKEQQELKRRERMEEMGQEYFAQAVDEDEQEAIEADEWEMEDEEIIDLDED